MHIYIFEIWFWYLHQDKDRKNGFPKWSTQLTIGYNMFKMILRMERDI